METISLSKKLTMAKMGLDKNVLKPLVEQNKGKKTEIASVLALVTSCTVKPSTLNPANMDFRFGGNFEGVNMLTGDVTRAAEAYLPGPAAVWLKAAYEKAQNDVGENAVPAMAFVITVEKDNHPNSAVGYIFGVKAILGDGAADPFEGLRKALPKPKAK